MNLKGRSATINPPSFRLYQSSHLPDCRSCFSWISLSLVTSSPTKLWWRCRGGNARPQTGCTPRRRRRRLGRRANLCPVSHPTKRQRAGAFQDASRISSVIVNAIASWSAAALGRFEITRGIRKSARGLAQSKTCRQFERY